MLLCAIFSVCRFGIAYGTWISIEALLTPIIGGVGTVFGPLLGALAVRSLGEGAKLVTGDVPGLDLILYGAVLVLVIWFTPRGLIGGCAQIARMVHAARPAGRSSGQPGGPWLIQWLIRFSSLIASRADSAACWP